MNTLKTMNRMLFALVLGIGATGTTSAAINPIADVHVGNYLVGNTEYLYVNSVPAQAWSILEFDVSAYSSMPVLELRLFWYHDYKWGGGTTPMPVSVYEYGEAVQESDIYAMDWYNYDTGNPIDSDAFPNISATGNGRWNSLTLIGADADNPISIFGNNWLRVVLQSTSPYDLGWNMVFYSKDYTGDPALWPYLEIKLGVSVDIKPGSDPNSINLCAKGTVPVAILGSTSFDVFAVNTELLRFAEASAKVVGKKDPHALCSYEDVNEDSFIDLVCQFVTTDIAGIDGESTTATVNGELLDGTSFEATDSVNIVKDTCN